MDLTEIFKGSPTDAKWQALGKYLLGGSVRGGPGVRVRKVGNQLVITGKKLRPAAVAADVPPCPFGRIETIPDSDPPEKGILGGVVHVGDQNFNVEHQALTLTADVDKLVWLEVSCTVNTDDDGVLLLPGVETGTAPTWQNGPYASGYPDNTPPTPATPTATVILPIGRLRIVDEVATLEPTGCGNFIITHCAGTVGYVRV